MTNAKVSSIRNYSLQFLYQCESEQLFFFSRSHYDSFSKYRGLVSREESQVKNLVHGCFRSLQEIDTAITQATKKWPLSRMPSTDRAVIRLATYEILKTRTPKKVVLNEAIELAKIYGTDQSAKFINGILDPLTAKLRKEA